jgi:alpha-beta hydrolase superfamily lysophospholipase
VTVIGHSTGAAVATALPVLVIFGTDDRRWRASSAAAYSAVPGARVEMLPGVGHTPMMEDPHTTGTLLLDFVAAAALPADHASNTVAKARTSRPPRPGGPL